jgi:hypothetical protein
MGWQIDLFRIPPGLDPRLVRDVQYGEVTSDLYTVPPPSEETDAWIYRVLALLEEVTPGLKLVDEPDASSFDQAGHIVHVRAWQPDDRLLVNIYPGSVDVRIQRGRLHGSTRARTSTRCGTPVASWRRGPSARSSRSTTTTPPT